MQCHHENSQALGRSESLLGSRAGFVLIGFLAVGGVLMLTEHRAHVLGSLYWLLPMACIFMHLFMHGGHHRHRRDGSGDEGERK